MADRREQQEVNRAWWDERAAFYLETAFYQKHVDRLRAGGVALLPLEVRELGDITGLDVAHLQCHVGTDTLSLARLGARAVGVDFSSVAIDRARALSRELGIAARFEQAEIAEFGNRFPESFDLVFTSSGVLSWLPDLELWARQIVASLRPGGRFYIAEMHPLTWAFAEERAVDGDVVRLGHPYLTQGEAARFEEGGSYADPQRRTEANATREWFWGLGDIANALLSAGLRLRWLREHDLGFYPVVPGMVEGDDGHWRLPPPLHGRYPLTFSIDAVRDGR